MITYLFVASASEHKSLFNGTLIVWNTWEIETDRNAHLWTLKLYGILLLIVVVSCVMVIQWLLTGDIWAWWVSVYRLDVDC